jgi:pimeloyl-ACP methyl ester carboxylesterase
VLLLHGGPGFDHSMFKPAFAPLADVAQLVLLDHRGNGRSDRGDPVFWTLDQWGDDVRAFCDTLGIEGPIVLGYSFGGFVAQSYAIRHPNHPAKLILYSTSPVLLDEPVLNAFEAIGGTEAREIATRCFANRTEATTAEFRRVCHAPQAAQVASCARAGAASPVREETRQADCGQILARR